MPIRQFDSPLTNIRFSLNYEPDRFYGSGGDTHRPVFSWQVDLMGACIEQKQLFKYVIRELRAVLFLKPAHQKLAECKPTIYQPFCGYIHQHDYRESPSLEFPINTAQIELIEKKRDGGSVQFCLELRMIVDEHKAIPIKLGDEDKTCFQLISSQSLSWREDFEISQSRWIKNVLPGLGYGNIHVMEFPAISIDATVENKHAFDALKQAQVHLHRGDYNDVAAKCRIALEKYFDPNGTLIDEWGNPILDKDKKPRKGPVLKSEWLTKLGRATYLWLNSMLGGIKVAANPTAHSTTPRFDRLEAQMLLAVTTSVVAYATRNMP